MPSCSPNAPDLFTAYIYQGAGQEKVTSSEGIPPKRQPVVRGGEGAGQENATRSGGIPRSKQPVDGGGEGADHEKVTSSGGIPPKRQPVFSGGEVSNNSTSVESGSGQLTMDDPKAPDCTDTIDNSKGLKPGCPDPNNQTESNPLATLVNLTRNFEENEESLVATVMDMIPYILYNVDESDLIKASHSLSETVCQCSFAGKPCDMENDFSMFHNPNYGNCYTYNKYGAMTVGKGGANDGLLLVVHSNQSEYLRFVHDAGFIMTIDDSFQQSFPTAGGVSLPVGNEISIVVRSITTHLFSSEGRKCHELGDEAIAYYYEDEYTFQGCIRSRLQDHVMDYCGCRSPLYPAESNMTKCSLDQKKCAEKYSVDNDEAYQLVKQLCHLPCVETAYSAIMSYSVWPTTVEEALCDADYDIKTFRRNFAKLEVYFEDTLQVVYQEEPLHTVSSLISDIGSILGFLTGMSVISLVEILFIVVELIRWKKSGPMARI